MDDETSNSNRELALLHLRGGWWMLLIFLSLGLVLETLHGFKVGFSHDLANETRRHLWTLAQAHGTLLALVNIALRLPERNPDRSSVTYE